MSWVFWVTWRHVAMTNLASPQPPTFLGVNSQNAAEHANGHKVRSRVYICVCAPMRWVRVVPYGGAIIKLYLEAVFLASLCSDKVRCLHASTARRSWERTRRDFSLRLTFESARACRADKSVWRWNVPPDISPWVKDIAGQWTCQIYQGDWFFISSMESKFFLFVLDLKHVSFNFKTYHSK